MTVSILIQRAFSAQSQLNIENKTQLKRNRGRINTALRLFVVNISRFLQHLIELLEPSFSHHYYPFLLCMFHRKLFSSNHLWKFGFLFILSFFFSKQRRKKMITNPNHSVIRCDSVYWLKLVRYPITHLKIYFFNFSMKLDVGGCGAVLRDEER